MTCLTAELLQHSLPARRHKAQIPGGPPVNNVPRLYRRFLHLSAPGCRPIAKFARISGLKLVGVRGFAPPASPKGHALVLLRSYYLAHHGIIGEGARQHAQFFEQRVAASEIVPRQGVDQQME